MKNTLKGGDVSGAFNRFVESLGFEFEFGNLYPTMDGNHLFNHYKNQDIDKHKKFNVILPEKYGNIVLKIGADGPYKRIEGEHEPIIHVFNLEMSVTFKNKEQCDNIISCFKLSIELLNDFINNAFVKNFNKYVYKNNRSFVIVNPSQSTPNCAPQCTLGVKYINIENLILQMNVIPQHILLQIQQLSSYLQLFISQYIPGELQKISLIWIFLFSINYVYLLLYSDNFINISEENKQLKLKEAGGEKIIFKKVTDIFFRHGLKSILPPQLKQLFFFLNQDTEVQKLDETLKTYLKYLLNSNYDKQVAISTNNFDEKTHILILGKNKQIDLEEHRSNFFDFDKEGNTIDVNTYLYFEYRSFNTDEQLITLLKLGQEHSSAQMDNAHLLSKYCSDNILKENDDDESFLSNPPADDTYFTIQLPPDDTGAAAVQPSEQLELSDVTRAAAGQPPEQLKLSDDTRAAAVQTQKRQKTEGAAAALNSGGYSSYTWFHHCY